MDDVMVSLHLLPIQTTRSDQLSSECLLCLRIMPMSLTGHIQATQDRENRPALRNQVFKTSHYTSITKSLNQSQKIFLLGSVQQLQQRPWKDQISVESIKVTAAFSPEPFINECFFTITCFDILKPNQTSFISASLSELHNALCFPCWLFYCLFASVSVSLSGFLLSHYTFK